MIYDRGDQCRLPVRALHLCACVCALHVRTTPFTFFNGYMLLNIIETGLPVDMLHLMDERPRIAGWDAFGVHGC